MATPDTFTRLFLFMFLRLVCPLNRLSSL